MKSLFLKLIILPILLFFYYCDNPNSPYSNAIDKGIVVYISNLNGNYDLYSLLLKENRIIQLTNSPEIKNKPHFFPNGNKILYSTSFTDGGKIFTINVDGTNNILLEDSCDYSALFDLSPDGQLIVFTKEIEFPPYINPPTFIALMNSNGANKRIISQFPGSQPRFSRDGSLICYTNYVGSQPQKIMLYNLISNSIDSIIIPGLGAHEAILNPKFSPKEDKILFCTNIDSSHALYSINLDGTNLKRVSPYSFFTQDFEYSPSGLSIIAAKGTKIYKIVDGTSISLSLNNSYFDLTPSFSPDGSMIVYSSDISGNREYNIILMDSDGNNRQLITNSKFIEWEPIIWF